MALLFFLEMKTHNRLYEKIISFENLLLAWRGARKGKTKKDYVIEFENNLREKSVKFAQRTKR